MLPRRAAVCACCVHMFGAPQAARDTARATACCCAPKALLARAMHRAPPFCVYESTPRGMPMCGSGVNVDSLCTHSQGTVRLLRAFCSTTQGPPDRRVDTSPDMTTTAAPPCDAGYDVLVPDTLRLRRSASSLTAYTARALTAPCDLVVRAGGTSLDPASISLFQAANVPTKITKGRVEVLRDVCVAKAGERVGAAAEALLLRLELLPSEYKGHPMCGDAELVRTVPLPAGRASVRFHLAAGEPEPALWASPGRSITRVEKQSVRRRAETDVRRPCASMLDVLDANVGRRVAVRVEKAVGSAVVHRVHRGRIVAVLRDAHAVVMTDAETGNACVCDMHDPVVEVEALDGGADALATAATIPETTTTAATLYTVYYTVDGEQGDAKLSLKQPFRGVHYAPKYTLVVDPSRRTVDVELTLSITNGSGTDIEAVDSVWCEETGCTTRVLPEPQRVPKPPAKARAPDEEYGPAAGVATAVLRGDEDVRFRLPRGVSIAGGSTACFRRTAAPMGFEEVYTADLQPSATTSLPVSHALSFENTGTDALVPAPVELVDKDRTICQTTQFESVCLPGAPAQVGLGPCDLVKVFYKPADEKTDEMKKTGPKLYARTVVKGRVQVANLQRVPVRVLLKFSCVGHVLWSQRDYTVSETHTDRDGEVNTVRNDVCWRVDVDPGKSVQFMFAYAFWEYMQGLGSASQAPPARAPPATAAPQPVRMEESEDDDDMGLFGLFD
eukprot:TRINITY_DN1688_c0_g3_i1.p1 TRINITY_DN1688_c0_g3~~TRINITY_DN1688_c0_g3_i1.p1  ORF type:complete len:728 (+),score=117.17 TRINITY_DN1688_c0_g3_i1:579-2762(+)